jgi:hypothetical protein
MRKDGPALHNAFDFYVPFYRLTSTEDHPLVSFPRVWNEFDSLEIKTTASKTLFIKLFKNIFLGKLEENYVCERLLCPHCHL